MPVKRHLQTAAVLILLHTSVTADEDSLQSSPPMLSGSWVPENPPQADFAVVHLVMHKPENPPGTTATFGEQFADDVLLTLKTQPALPVRLAQK